MIQLSIKKTTSFLLVPLVIGLTSSSALSDSKESPNFNDLPPSLHPGDVSLGFIHERNLSGKVPAGLLHLSEGSRYFSNYAFIVDKTARSLGVWSIKNGRPVRLGHYPSDMGKKKGDKTLTGDHRTPEGIYFLQERFEGKNLSYELYGSRAFGTNYPNLFDRREGKTGSGIWLHAVPDTTPLTRGSRGCVVVRDEIIKKVSQFINLRKTPIIITSAEKYLSIDEWQEKKTSLANWLNQWRLSWQSKDLDKYMSFYSKAEFRSRRKGWASWRKYKRSIAKANKKIRVEFTHPNIYTHRSEAIVKFLQRYQSDKIEDFGEKTLYLKKEDGNWKIVAERWFKINPRHWHAEVTPPARTPSDDKAIGTARVDHPTRTENN